MALAIDTSKTSPNRSRSKLDPRGIVIHHWDDPRKHPKFSGVVSWFMNPASNVSAHYVVESGRIARMVPENQRAWHARGGNSKYLGIEANPRQSDGDYETVGALVADIWRRHGILPLIRHRDVTGSSTDCPGTWDLDRIRTIAKRHLGGGGGTSVPSSGGSKPAAKPGKLDEDGRLGTSTISELQRRLGVPVDGRAAEDTWKALQEFLDAPYKDGVISRQSYAADELGNGIVPRAWESTGRGSDGSQTVELLQAYVGAPVDGIWFEGTTKRIQILMNAYPAAFTPADRGVAKARAEKHGL